MKTVLKKSVALMALSTVMLAGAAQAQQKIGVVDMMEIFQQLPQREQIAESLQNEFGNRIEEMRELEQRVEEIRTQGERDASIMSEEQQQELRDELQTLLAEAQTKGQALNEDSRRRQTEERNRLLGQIQQVINDVAAEQGYDLVLQSNAVAYIDTDNDLSDEVVAEMTEGQ